MKAWIKHIICGALWVQVLYGWSQTDQHISVMDRIHIVPLASMSVINPAAVDPTGTSGSELYLKKYEAVVNLIYGRELNTDIEGDEWGFRVLYEIQGVSNNMLFEGEATIQIFPDRTVYLDQQRFPVVDGFAKLVVKEIFHTNDNWQNESQDLLGIFMNVPADVRLELKMETFRFDYLDVTDKIELLQLSTDNGDLVAEWKHKPGAETYQLEFSFITEDLHSGAIEFDTFENPVRVEVAENNYRIPITYPEGTIYARVRSVGRHIRHGIVEPVEEYYQKAGTWSDTASIAIEFEDDKNWQAITSYAEEGKYKKVVEFFDAGLKSRQNATNLSTDSIVIRASTEYDFEGRSVISILPAPDLSSNSLEFISGLNPLPPTTFENSSLPQELPATNGAGLYFSSSNPGTIGLHSKYIADAEGFPYTRMKYLNDGTGRVQAQSGLGALYTLESGRETKYHYDDPSDTQLRRLFGHNVGEAKYYKRSIVMDPDSQIMISYVDIAGNTIATALAGKSPSNVHALDSEDDGTDTLTHNIHNQVDSISGISWATTTIFNELPGTEYNFNYSLTGIVVDHGANICLGCDYELVFDIIDPCGDSIYVDTFQFSGADLCGDTTFTNSGISFGKVFDTIGMYTLTKKLTSIPMSMEEWMIELADILPDSTYFEELYLSQIDTSECLQSCDQFCRDSILAINPNINPDTLDSLVLICIQINCVDTLFLEGPTFLCDAILTQMKFHLQDSGCLFSYWDDPGKISHLTFVVDGEDVPGTQMYDVLRGLLIWEDSWSDTLATIHPQYCCYENCLKLVKSRRFDFKLHDLFTWANITADPSYVVLRDSFFIFEPGAQYRNQMISDLASFGNDQHDHPVDGCGFPPFGAVSLVQFINCIFADSTDQIKYQIYVSIYLGLKQKYVQKVDDPCKDEAPDTCNACMHIPEDFINIDSVEEAIDYTNMLLDSLCTDVCMGQATMAANILYYSCEADSSWQSLYDLLYEHCTAVCGYQNPLGAYLEEDLDEETLQDIYDWLTQNGCDTALFDTLIVVPFDSVYIPLGFPQNAGIDVVDTVCMSDTTYLYILHDSLYTATLDPTYLDSVLNGQQHLIDTGLYYFLGFDPLCGQLLDTPTFELDSAVFNWYDSTNNWAPGTLLGSWPVLSDFELSGCYTFGFYTPSMPGACSEYSEVTLYVPGCDEPELVLDSIGECIVAAHLEFGPDTGPIDTIIWSVSIDNLPDVPYEEWDTLYYGDSYEFNVQVIYSACCDTINLNAELTCGCVICEEQTVDICTERVLYLVLESGDTLDFVAEPHCDSPLGNDLFAEALENFLESIDTCGNPEVSWIDLSMNSDTCHCTRIVVEGTSILLDFFINGHPTDPIDTFDHSNCDSIRIRSVEGSVTAIDPNKDIKNASIFLYPNPARSSFNLEFTHPYEIRGMYTVAVMDFSGAVLFSQDFTSSGYFDKNLIDVSTITPGVYKVLVRDMYGHYSTTIVLMR